MSSQTNLKNSGLWPAVISKPVAVKDTKGTPKNKKMTHGSLKYVFQNFAENTTAHAPPKVSNLYGWSVLDNVLSALPIKLKCYYSI